MVDKVKPLKLHDSNEDIPVPTGFNVTDDYAAVKGVAFEGLDTLLVDKSAGGNLQFTDPAEPTGREFSDIGDQADAARYSMILQCQGTINNGFFYGYSNTIPGDSTPIIVPVDSTFTGFTWSNQSTGADYTLDFRKNSTVATPFYSISKVDTQYFTDQGPDEDFDEGDEIYIQHVKDGNNASDVGLVLYWKVRI